MRYRVLLESPSASRLLARTLHRWRGPSICTLNMTVGNTMSNVTKILSIVATCVAFAALAIASAPTGQQMTDAMYSAFGDNLSRAVHAKGTMVGGTFTPDPAARSLSKAKLFTLPTAKV